MDDELRTLRERVSQLEATLDRLEGNVSPGAACMLVKVTTDNGHSTPTSGHDVYYKAKPVDPGGSESEGSTVSTTDNDGTVLIGIVGTKLPPKNTILVVYLCGGRWLVVYNG